MVWVESTTLCTQTRVILSYLVDGCQADLPEDPSLDDITTAEMWTCTGSPRLRTFRSRSTTC